MVMDHALKYRVLACIETGRMFNYTDYGLSYEQYESIIDILTKEGYINNNDITYKAVEFLEKNVI
jgi:uncharacterized protein YutE (UPF0331/DUF86 family)